MNDPMDALRLPVVPVVPRPAFATDLRARVQAWLGGDDDPAAGTVAPVAPAAQVMPYLSVRGGVAALRWYRDVFGARLSTDPIIEANGRLGHAEIVIGNAKVGVADEYPELDILSPRSRGGTSVQLQLTVVDTDATFARAVAAGASVRRPPSDEFYGARVAQVEDPWGHVWFLQQPTEVLTDADLAERMAGTEYGFRDLDSLPDDLPDELLDVPVVDLGARPAQDQSRLPDRDGDLGYFTLDVPDPDVSADFFRALFGWQIEQGDLPEGRHIASVAPPGGIHGGRPPGATLYFRVDDLPAAVARVRQLGGDVESVDDWATGGGASCRDPQGVPFQLWKPAPGY